MNIATALVWSAFRENQLYSVQNQVSMSIPECKLLFCVCRMPSTTENKLRTSCKVVIRDAQTFQ